MCYPAILLASSQSRLHVDVARMLNYRGLNPASERLRWTASMPEIIW